ncbi:MAG: T9SS type A sorting domain-containing protein [Bacteroidetes bacterium]|nr:T9SS type A sorting domain-containing protein [Bacteroidota bacterium]
MKRILILSIIFLSLCFLPLLAQECYKSSWAKAFGGTSPYDGMIDASRRFDGKFVIAGGFGNATLTLTPVSVTSSGTYNIYIAVHDSGGIFSSAAVAAYYTSAGDQLTLTRMNVGVDGSVYITGYYQGSTIHIGTSLLPTVSRKVVFAAKFDSSLAFQWEKHNEWQPADAYAYGITSDENKNVYVTGSFSHNAFIVDGIAADNSGPWDGWTGEGFFFKVDSSGNVKYVNSFGTAASDGGGRTITADSSGNVIIASYTGASNTTYLFDQQTGVSIGTNSTFQTAIGKYAGSDGHCIWGKIVGGSMSVSDACAGENNGFFICGTTNGVVNFYPNTYSNTDNGFIAKIDSNGNNLWMESDGGGSSWTENMGAVSYYNGMVAVCGNSMSSYPYLGKFPLNSVVNGAGTFMGFNAQYQTNGKLIWARVNTNSTSSTYYNSHPLIDNAGNQLLWGNFKSTQTWYPNSLTNGGSNFKLFLTKFIPFSPASSFTVSAGPDKISTCGTSVQLSGSTNPSGISFGWSPDLGFFNNGTKTPTVNPGISTNYILFGSYQGCVNSDTVNVSYSNAAVTVSAGVDLNFCGGDSAHIFTTCNQPTATYSWSPTQYLNTSSSANPYAKPPFTTDYAVTATYNNCKAYDTVKIYSRAKPYIFLNKQNYINPYWYTHLCSADTLHLNMGDPSNSYTVSPLSMVANVNNNLVDVLGNTSGMLRVTAMSPYGCIKKDSVYVSVHNNQSAPPIQGTVASPRSACIGDSLQIPLYITNSLTYNFQYGWYAGWQEDSLDGNGWHDINYWNSDFDIFDFSVGSPTSSFYSYLRILNVKSQMNGYKYRCYVYDYCSPRNYSNVCTIIIAPKISAQPQNKNLCAGVTDSINVNTSSAGANYNWEIKLGGVWVPFVNQPGVMTANGRFLKVINAQTSVDSTWARCRINGCIPASDIYSDSALIRVISQPVIISQSMGDTLCEMQNDSLMVYTNSSQYTFKWYQNYAPITPSAQYSGINTSKLLITPLYLTNNNSVYKCRISYAGCNYSAYSQSVRFYIDTLRTINWTGGLVNICMDSSFSSVLLSGATPAGGIYSGPGVYCGYFYPDSVGVGTYTLTYTFAGMQGGCSNASGNMIFQISQIPVVSWTGGPVNTCLGSSPIVLSGGNPSGGVYSGPGVSAGSFNMNIVGVGTYTLVYTYTDPLTTCSNSDSMIFIVNACTGINETDAGAMQFYFDNTAHIISFNQNDFTDAYRATVFDMYGQLIAQRDYNNGEKKGNLILPLTSSGIYFVKFSDETKSKTYKISVTH